MRTLCRLFLPYHKRPGGGLLAFIPFMTFAAVLRVCRGMGTICGVVLAGLVLADPICWELGATEAGSWQRGIQAWLP